MTTTTRWIAMLAGLLLWGCQPAQPPADAPAPAGTEAAVPEAAHTGKRAVAENGMVSAAHPLASEAGVEIMQQGGNAVDAAVATAFAVGVVEPMMSGIGGSGGMLIWNQAEAHTDYLDFYARAPAEPDLSFVDYDGPGHTPRGVAVPGTVAGLLEAHERDGVLAREQVIRPAIRLAEDGFPVSPLLARTIADDSAKLTQYERSQELFWPEHEPLAPGEMLRQPELAETLRRISDEGRAGFHEGPVAEEIITLLNDGGNPMTLEDLSGYTPVWRRPMCGAYRGRTVLSAPPPQSGMQIIQTLHLLEAHDLADLGLPTQSGEAFHALTAALRTATADRMAYLADPDQVGVPAAGIVSPAYADERRGSDGVPERVEAGDPWPMDDDTPAEGCAELDPYASSDLVRAAALPSARDNHDDAAGETTHLSVVDADGNAVSLTFTQGAYFGTGAWAAGTFLNNAMFIFSGDPDSPNMLAPGKAPGSTTTPTIILEDGAVRMVVGSPGGGRIPPAVVQSIVYTLDYDLDPLEALRMPRIHPHVTAPRVQFEQGLAGDMLGNARERGYRLEVMPPASLYFGGVHLIDRRDGRWVGAADPRRDGEVRGY